MIRRQFATAIVIGLVACAPSASPAPSATVVVSTQSSAPTTPTPAPAQLTLGLAFFSDNLYRDNDRAWPVGQSADASQSFDIGHGYVVKMGAAAAMYAGPSFVGVAKEKLSDYAVDVQAANVLGVGRQAAIGVFCRYASPSTELYSFVIRFGAGGSETYEIWRDNRAAGAQPRKLASETAAPATPAATRILRAVCVGGQSGPATLLFYVDGRQALRTTDVVSPLTAGLAGLVVWRGASSTAEPTATFSFFTVAPATLGP